MIRLVPLVVGDSGVVNVAVVVMMMMMMDIGGGGVVVVMMMMDIDVVAADGQCEMRVCHCDLGAAALCLHGETVCCVPHESLCVPVHSSPCTEIDCCKNCEGCYGNSNSRFWGLIG